MDDAKADADAKAKVADTEAEAADASMAPMPEKLPGSLMPDMSSVRYGCISDMLCWLCCLLAELEHVAVLCNINCLPVPWAHGPAWTHRQGRGGAAHV